MEKQNRTLFYLNELSDYKVASDDPDVRGWKVNDKDQRCIGKVDNLLVNKNTERVVYLDVEVDSDIIEEKHKVYSSSRTNEGVHQFLNKDGENHIIIPIGLVSLDKDSKKVHTQNVDYQTFAETKRYSKGTNIDRDYEHWVLSNYDRNNEVFPEVFPEGDDLYDRDEFKRRY